MITCVYWIYDRLVYLYDYLYLLAIECYFICRHVIAIVRLRQSCLVLKDKIHRAVRIDCRPCEVVQSGKSPKSGMDKLYTL